MACFILLYCFILYLNFSHVTKLKRNHIILLNHVRSSSIRFSNLNWQIRISLVRIAVRVTRRPPIRSAFRFCSENGPSANDSFNSSSSSCAPSESVLFIPGHARGAAEGRAQRAGRHRQTPFSHMPHAAETLSPGLPICIQTCEEVFVVLLVWQ